MQNLSNQVYSFTKRKLLSLAERPEPETRAVLANLRRGVGRMPGEIPQLYGEFLLDMPEEMYSVRGGPSYEEWAIYTALTLYALHQQGRNIKTDNMNSEKNSIATAASILAGSNQEDRERIWKRFYTIVLSSDMKELSYRLRGLIQLLRGEGIPLDYAHLAKELYFYQLSEESANQIRLNWGQDFYRKHMLENEEEKNNEKK